MADLTLQIGQLSKAVEFAHYLAKDAEEFLATVNERDALLLKIEEGEVGAEDALQHANEAVNEFARGLRSGIHEFRKRAERIASKDGMAERGSAGAPPKQPEATKATSGAIGEIPDYVPPEQRGTELVTYWLYYGQQCVGEKRMPVGTGAVDVRNAAIREAVIFCDRANGESPIERETKIRHSVVKVFNDRAVQERMRRELPFKQRALFPKEIPFFELTFRSALSGVRGSLEVKDVLVGLEGIAWTEAAGLTFLAGENYERTVKVQYDGPEALARCEAAMKAYLVQRGIELVSEYGVGYQPIEPTSPGELVDAMETETDVESPRG